MLDTDQNQHFYEIYLRSKISDPLLVVEFFFLVFEKQISVSFSILLPSSVAVGAQVLVAPIYIIGMPKCQVI